MVESIISKRKSIVSILKEFGIDYRELKRLVARVREHGIDEVFKKKEHTYYEECLGMRLISIKDFQALLSTQTRDGSTRTRGG